MTPGFLKMPEPITPPTTIITVVNRPRAGRRPGGRLGEERAFIIQSSKSQMPNSKKAPNSKHQPDPTQPGMFEIWGLVVGILLEFGFCDLGFALTVLLETRSNLPVPVCSLPFPVPAA